MAPEKDRNTLQFSQLLKSGICRDVTAGIAAMIRKPKCFRIKQLDFDFIGHQLGAGAGISRIDQAALLSHKILDLLPPPGKTPAKGFRRDTLNLAALHTRDFENDSKDKDQSNLTA